MSLVLNHRVKISSTVLKAMARQGIDITWLLTGEGEMFISQGNVGSSSLESSEVSDLKDELIQSVKGQIEILKEDLRRSDETISELKRRGEVE